MEIEERKALVLELQRAATRVADKVSLLTADHWRLCELAERVRKGGELPEDGPTRALFERWGV